MKTRLLVISVVVSLLGAPVLSWAKAGGGYRGGRGSSSSGMSSNSMGSRGSRTLEDNGFKPIERSTAAPPAAAGTGRPSGGAASTSAPPTPAAQTSFLQRHPIMTGLAAGLAGSWLGHMLFGATSAPGATHDGSGTTARQEDGGAASGSGPSPGLLLVMMVLIGFGFWYWYKRRTASLSPALARFGSANPASPVWVPPSIGVLSPLPEEHKVTDADEEEFRRLLVEIQTAWSDQNLQRLRRAMTPEMCEYFSEKLAENVSRGLENRIEDVVVTSTDVCESWVEETRQYATVRFEWNARDYVRTLTSEAEVSGVSAVSQCSEAWTFVKYQEGGWLLSAIQQVN